MNGLLLLVILFQSPSPAEPDQLYAEAITAMENANWGEAIEKLEAVLSADPSHLGSRFNLAVSLTEAGQNERAAQVYREILADDPGMFEARMNLAILLGESGSQDGAAVEFASAAALHPEDPLPRLYRAQMLDQMGATTAAIAAYQDVVDLAPNRIEPHERLGILYRNDESFDLALEELRTAVELGTANPTVFVTLGDMESERNDSAEALRYYEKAAELAPDDFNIQIRLARTLRDQEQLGRTIAILKQLEGVDAALAEAYMANGDYQDAAVLYENLTVAEPDNPDYWYLLGSAYFEEGRIAEAEGALGMAVRLRPDSASAWGRLATIYLEREDWRNAGIMLSQLVGIEPDHAPSHFLLALCFDNLGDFENALVHYNRFIQLDDGADDVRSFQVRQRVESLERFLRENN